MAFLSNGKDSSHGLATRFFGCSKSDWTCRMKSFSVISLATVLALATRSPQVQVYMLSSPNDSASWGQRKQGTSGNSCSIQKQSAEIKNLWCISVATLAKLHKKHS